MTHLKMHDWEEHQTYRHDRPPPPWIKVHRRIFMSRKWARLTDAEKGQLISLWIVAADQGGRIPADPYLLRKIAMLDEEPDLNKFIDLGLMTPDGRQDDVMMTPDGRQDDAPEAEAEAEAEAEKENPSASPDELKKELFDLARQILVPVVSEKQAGSLTGKLLKVCGQDEVSAFVILHDCEGKESPHKYLAKCISRKEAEMKEMAELDARERRQIEEQEKVYAGGWQ